MSFLHDFFNACYSFTIFIVFVTEERFAVEFLSLICRYLPFVPETPILRAYVI